jgi:FR47-like protein
MGWFTTGAVTEFLAETGEFLRAEPARNTVILSVTENLRLRAAALPDGHQAPDDHHVESGPGRPDTGPGRSSQPACDEPLFGWWRPGPSLTSGPAERDPDPLSAAFMHTPGFYTPPALRGRGYAGGATAAVSQAALDAGATQVVLYTDPANPTSNALYERLGYRPVEDRVVLAFEPRHPAAR